MAMAELPPILVAGLFREISRHLVAVLRSLGGDEWHRPSSSSRRNVKDVASHLLDGSLRRLSMQRDGYFAPDESGRPRCDESLLDLLTRLNADWETATRRLSPVVLVGLIEWADEQLADLFESLDPFGPAIFAVAWAGEQQSLNWLDVARDYTEKWHHTQQIFEATGRESTITTRDLFHPCLDTFMRALPFTYRHVAAERGTCVAVELTGPAGGRWFLERRDDAWQLVSRPSRAIHSIVTLDQLAFWKLVTKRRAPEARRADFAEVRIEGDAVLGNHVLEVVAMMA